MNKETCAEKRKALSLVLPTNQPAASIIKFMRVPDSKTHTEKEKNGNMAVQEKEGRGKTEAKRKISHIFFVAGRPFECIVPRMNQRIF